MGQLRSSQRSAAWSQCPVCARLALPWTFSATTHASTQAPSRMGAGPARLSRFERSLKKVGSNESYEPDSQAGAAAAAAKGREVDTRGLDSLSDLRRIVFFELPPLGQAIGGGRQHAALGSLCPVPCCRAPSPGYHSPESPLLAFSERRCLQSRGDRGWQCTLRAAHAKQPASPPRLDVKTDTTWLGILPDAWEAHLFSARALHRSAATPATNVRCCRHKQRAMQV